MSTSTAAETRRLGVETTGIEIIDEAERTASPRDLFWPWFAANVSVFGISYAAFVLQFGVSFWQGVLVAVVGITVSFALCGVIAIAGKRGSAPTMVLSRAAFGVTGQKVPGVISWLTSIGWETFLAILAVLATVDDLQPARLGRRHRHQGRRGRRRRRAHRLGVGGRLPHHHADAVGAHLGHGHRHDPLHRASPSRTSTGPPSARCPAGRRRRSSGPSSW